MRGNFNSEKFDPSKWAETEHLEAFKNETLCKMVLRPRIFWVVRLRLGLYGERPHSLRSVGEIIGTVRDASTPVGKNQVRQLYLKGLRMISWRLALFGKALHDPDDPYFTPLWFGHPKPGETELQACEAALAEYARWGCASYEGWRKKSDRHPLPGWSAPDRSPGWRGRYWDRSEKREAHLNALREKQKILRQQEEGQ